MQGVQYTKISFGIVGSGACGDHTFFIQFYTLYTTNWHNLICLTMYFQKSSRLAFVRRWSISVVSLYGSRVFHTKG